MREHPGLRRPSCTRTPEDRISTGLDGGWRPRACGIAEEQLLPFKTLTVYKGNATQCKTCANINSCAALGPPKLSKVHVVAAQVPRNRTADAKSIGSLQT